tara:strand:- start:180 stop:2090 length:1911 start_codon:yes stop_codon:yes gene_type:complete
MCGFVGQVSGYKISDEQLSSLDLAAKSIKFRGPDYVGRWTSLKKNVAIIHNRLSILDITKSGNQPMQSSNNRFVLAYNGELYNYLEIKKKISRDFTNVKWNGTSDTEVFLKSIEYYGLDYSLKIFNGMFSFSLWDNQNNILFLGRDLIGEKPLYYSYINNNFYFSSQIRCFKSLGINLDIDVKALQLYLNLNYIPSPYSIFKNVKKLSPGSILKYDFNTNKIDIKKFRKIKFDQKENNNNSIDSLDKILHEVIEQQLVADVPVGIFLSGGLDSSLVASIASKVSTKKIQTFCISQKNKNYDESNISNLVSKKLNTEHKNILIDKNNILDASERISEIYDEPFSDSSQIPSIILCKEVSQYGKVFLTGDGGDEIFGGYNRYIYINLFNNLIKKIHPYIRKKIKVLLKLISSLDLTLLNKLFFKFYQNFNNKLLKISHVIDLNNSISIYKNLIINFNTGKFLKENINIENYFLNGSIFANENINDVEKFMLQDINTYLPDDIFVKTDRASMYFSIETRSPLVDKRIIEFTEKINLDQKIKGFNNKMLIRELLKKYIPSEIINKKKMGFGLPLDDLIRNELKDFTVSSLKDLEKIDIPFVNFNEVNYMMKLHFEKKKNYSYELWNLVILSSWYRKFYSD